MKAEVNIYLGDKFITIAGSDDTNNGVPVIKMDATLTQQELSFINIVGESLRCLINEKNIDHHYNPTITAEDQQRILKCEWLRSGRLVIRDEKFSGHFRHADTVEIAMTRKRVFTCTMAVYKQLPRKRARNYIGV